MMSMFKGAWRQNIFWFYRPLANIFLFKIVTCICKLIFVLRNKQVNKSIKKINVKQLENTLMSNKFVDLIWNITS